MAQEFTPGGVLVLKLFFLGAPGLPAAGSVAACRYLQGPYSLARRRRLR
jgi:hypothetical protein